MGLLPALAGAASGSFKLHDGNNNSFLYYDYYYHYIITNSVDLQ